MTLDEKKRLIAMREAGNSYAEIADTLGISKNTIKTFFRRNRMMCENQEQSDPGDNEHKAEKLCINCGNPVIQQPGRKVKKFCSDVFERERCYGLVMHQMKRLLASGLITTDEFREIEARFRAKYHPVTGSVLVETQLLCIENGVINGSGKEGSDNEENQYSGASGAGV